MPPRTLPRRRHRLHPLVRIAGLGLVREKEPGKGRVLDVEALTEWLAERVRMPYLRIDPLKVDVGRVAEVMSISYAERRARCRSTSACAT